MFKLQTISISGKYIGSNKRGLVVGGILMLPQMPATLVHVTEDTYNFLQQGVKSGWFKIEKDNYEAFCISRDRKKYESPEDIELDGADPSEDEELVSKIEDNKDTDDISSETTIEEDKEKSTPKTKPRTRKTKTKEVEE